MTVAELIATLSSLPPDMELWQNDPYGVGSVPARIRPRVESLHTDPTGRRKPRLGHSFMYESKPDGWPDQRDVVAL